MKNIFDKVQAVVEYLIAALFVYGGISLIGRPPLEGEGFVTLVFGGQVALYFYIFLFTFLGVGLIYAKLSQRKRVHKAFLLGMYLTTIYTAILTVALIGFSWVNIADDVAVGVLAAVFWLRWKFKTEYIDHNELRKEIDKMRDDLPPSR